MTDDVASAGRPSHSRTRSGSPAICSESMVTSVCASSEGCGTPVLPLDEEGQLGVGLQALDPELAPAQLDAVGAVPVADDGLAAEPRLHLGDVVDLHDPPEPAAARLRARADDLAERGLVAGRVVEHLDDLDVALVGQRQDDVARPEARVDSPIDRCDTDLLREALRRGLEAVALGGIDDVVNSHADHRRTRDRGAPDTAPGHREDRGAGVAAPPSHSPLGSHEDRWRTAS